MDLLNRFKPRIVFDSREVFFPSSVEYYLANSESDEKKMSISATDNLDMDNIHKLSEHTNIRAYNKDCLAGFHTASDISDAPMYGTVSEREKIWLLQYVLFFPYRGPYYLCGCLPICGNAEVNIRFIYMMVDKKTEDLIGVYCDGTASFIKPKQLHKIDDTVILYSALYTHVIYPHPGSYPNSIFLYDENDENGLVWSPKRLEYIDEKTSWNNFSGTLGDNAYSPMHNQKWLNPFCT